ncbi:hypothetical protein D0C36_06540 [Mucilaginibacter conchicola]|uniref:Uncharacterized protein n=1 Tax=Mucilaginibacter conchicola TaxID=2303333 RepID=A0A372NZ54_9SPHI|nr:hypothetical protein [Mucilaginibacter conchicola]RFZ95181.1 hypothetical protein D0C36_06540 [Mucilaginibacter conchicola]
MDLIDKLFKEWDLSAWSNVLGILGFVGSTGAFILSLFIRSDIEKIKLGYLFDKTIVKHIKNLESIASQISNALNDYDNNRDLIRTKFSECQIELEKIIPKLSYGEKGKSRRLIKFLKRKKVLPFVNFSIVGTSLISLIIQKPKGLYQTNYNDVWLVYNRLVEIGVQLKHIKLNKDKSL